jgi:GT2 family glycosyltransferase
LTLRSLYPISAADAKPERFLTILAANVPSESRRTATALSPQADVEVVDGRMVATSQEPWLRIENTRAFRPGGFVEITYRVSLFDDPVRPILRFRLKGGAEVDRFLPGPVAGAGIWVGRVPHGTTEIWISPTRHRGRFDFVVEQARPRNGVALWLKALWRSPRYALSALFYGVPGFIAEYDMNLDWALGFTPIEKFEEWRRARTRPLDLSGIDAPRGDWANAPRIHVLLVGSDAKDASLKSLSTQIYTNWQLHHSAEFSPSLGEAADTDLVFVLRAGDRLEPHAFACAIEHAARHPKQRISYADEMEWSGEGACIPLFKPDWSPLLQTARPYLGRAIFVRLAFLRSRGAAAVPEDLAALIGAPEAFTADAIGHLRRLVLTRTSHTDNAQPVPRDIARAEGGAAPLPASIVIPSRDRGDLLQKCVASIVANTTHPEYGVVIVDNGSVEPATRRILAGLAEDPRVTVLARPGPFNFAGLCNAGAAAGAQPILVFLNDDTSVRTPDWLARLSAAAAQPESGAVGAKLLYPDGRVQHAGVSLGIGETVGHFGAGAAASDPGWAGRHAAIHEVSAVTGACLAVERRKFEAVGGFDAQNLPIEMNDVDLCLRLGERGWKTLCLPEPSLIHEESASRGGAKFRLLKVHAAERAYFLRRWRKQVRDDPYFHPGFALFRRQRALG